MEASTSTLCMAAEAIEAQTQLDDKVRALNLLESCGVAGEAGSAKVSAAWREARGYCFEFNVEPAGSITLKYPNLGRCNSKK